MELLYMWIGRFRNLKDVGIHFSDKYTVKETKFTNAITLEINKKPTYSLPFSPNIKNISAIIGKNGTGKTSVIQNIFFLSPPESGVDFISENKNIVKIYSYDNELFLR